MSINQTSVIAFFLFYLATGFAHAELVAADDNYGIPVSRVLLAEAPGVLGNDILDGQTAGDAGVTATLHADVTKGTLACPGVSPGLCEDGSFEYTPGPGFDGFDSFQYIAVSASTSETSPPVTVNITACSGGPRTYTCWLETAYLNKLSELGFTNTFQESFEGTLWDGARSPDTAPGIQSKGINWTTNHPVTNEISTSTGPARTGVWGVFDPDHGVATGTIIECDVDNPPVHCLYYDGFSGSMPGPDVMYGVGGYISGFTLANVDIILDGAAHNAGRVPGPGHYFMGVIDTAGFNVFEFRELEGKVGQSLYIFGDDFIIATSATLPVNTAPVLATIGNQSTDENIQLSIPLSASDSDDGDTVSFSMSGAPAGAVLYGNGDGTADFIWRPDYSQAGSYSVTFTVSDSAIPEATDSETITITVNDVNRPPVLSAIGDKSVDVNTELSFQLSASDPDGNSLSFVNSGGPAAASLLDNGDGTATFSWTPNVGEAGDHTVTFTVSDNGVPVASDLETITISVIDPFVDITPPQVQINSPANGAALTSASVTVSGTASDDTALDGVTVNGVAATVDGGNFSADVVLVAGANSITAIATDASGNSTSSSIQVSYTPPDVTPPVITLLGNDPVSIEAGSSYTDAGATASDNLDGDISGSIVVTGTVNASVVGSYTLTYNVSDAAGNPASTVTRTVNVTADVTPPVITLLGNNPISVEAGGNYVEPGATATDTLDGDISGSIAVTGSVNTGLVGTYILTYNVSDAAGNPAVAVTRTVNVTADVTPPVITLLGSDPVNIEAGSTYTDAGATATDNLDGDISGSIVVTGTVNTGLVGAYTLTYNVSDAAGNPAVAVTRTVNVTADVTPPVITLLGSDPVNIEAGSTYTDAGATATDNLDGDISGSIVVTGTVDTGLVGAYTLTYNVSDAAGNPAAAVTRTVNVTNTAPVADAGPAQTAMLGNTVTLDGSGSSDADGNPLTFSWSLTPPGGSVATLSDPSDVKPSFDIDVHGVYTAELIVNDGFEDSAADTVIISTVNSAPVADAGSDQTAQLGNTVTLDGSGSSDADGDPLTFNWLLIPPGGSVATLSDPSDVKPTFDIDVHGIYTAELIVNDGFEDSTADTVIISTVNSAPVADAGPDQAARVNDTVTLDGGSSIDVDGDTLTYRWSFIKVPTGSAAALSNTAAVNPDFTVDLPGTYVAQLIVSDGTVDSAADTVSISTINSAPVADAGPDQTARVNDTVTLDGSASSDVDFDPLTFSWSLTAPVGSAASLSDSTIVNPSFIVDVPGDYVAQLIVNDTTVNSAPDTITVSTTNSTPVADAGADQTALTGDTVFLDGGGSSDADGDALTFSWSLTSVPLGSGASLSDPANVTPSFVIDQPGTYVAQLIVNDGTVTSAADTVRIVTVGNLQFSEEHYKVNEYETSVTITVTRVGGSSGSVSVDYATRDGTATAGSDYEAVSGTLDFADGVTRQSFIINILQDTETEGNESLKIVLKNYPDGAGLGSPSTALLTIIEKDEIFGTSSSSGSFDLITLMLLFSFYLRNFRKKNIYRY